MRFSALFPIFGSASTVLSTGTFLTPSGTDGSLSVTTGDTIDISWTNTSDYDVLSVGYYSTSNQTITWVITNDQSHPTSYRWTVDAVAEGFNLADSKLFAFYGCKDYNFGDPFISSYFVINDADSAASSSTSSASGSTATSTTAFSTITSSAITGTSTLPSSITPSNTPTTSSTVAASSSTSSSSSDGLSTGAKAGLAVAIVLGVACLVGIVTLILLRRRKQRNYGAKQLIEADSVPQSSAYEKARMQQSPNADAFAYTQDHKYAPYTGVHEAPGSAPGHLGNSAPVELGTGHAGESGMGRVELPTGR